MKPKKLRQKLRHWDEKMVCRQPRKLAKPKSKQPRKEVEDYVCWAGTIFSSQ